MRSRSLLLSVFTISLVSLALSYFKFARCIPGGWISPDVYQQGCYTDITGLYQVRGFISDIWPYGAGSDSLEYPILSGIGMWLISLITRDGATGLNQFFYFNLFALALTYVALIYLIFRWNRKSALLFAISPAVLSALFINWDIWAITPFIFALYLLQRERYWLSGAMASVSVSFKFFPVIYVIPILLTLLEKSGARARFAYGLIITSLVINLPFALTQFDGWSKFYIFNYERGVDFGSIWYLISLQGSWISDLNWVATPLVALLLIASYVRYRDQLLGSIYIASVIFFTLNKVYSPQYVLWLTVVAVLYFPKTRTFYGLFILWQGSELAYQLGIWRHILTILNQEGGITNETYIAITWIRIGTLLLLAGYAVYLLENDLMKSRRSKTNG